MASSLSDAIEFRGACDRGPLGCGAELSYTMSPEEAEGKTSTIRYRCPHCGLTNQLERRTKVEGQG